MTTTGAVPSGGATESSPETTPPGTDSSKLSPLAAPLTSGTPPRSGREPDGETAQQPHASAPAESAAFDTSTLPQLFNILGAVVAPTTLLTALLYYFGRAHATGLFGHFGVHVTVLDLTVQDYLIRGVDGLIVPLVFLVGAVLLTLWSRLLVLAALPTEKRSTVRRALAPLAGVAGIILATIAVVDLLGVITFRNYPEVRGLSLSIGVLLLAYAAHALRKIIAERQPERVSRKARHSMIIGEWGAVFALVSVGLFWAVGNYAIGVGRGNAYQIEASLAYFPNLAVYSEKRLDLQGPGVHETPCRQDNTAYRFRYDGLKLVHQSGNHYLFLPAGWTRTEGAAMLVQRNEILWLEFSPAGHVQNSTC
jgi:hypothetical protein